MCGELYTPRSATQKYCSADCKRANDRTRWQEYNASLIASNGGAQVDPLCETVDYRRALNEWGSYPELIRDFLESLADGRVDGRFRCPVCGMRAHESEQARICCGEARPGEGTDTLDAVLVEMAENLGEAE